MDIASVPLSQVLKGRDGREYEISGHAADIAQQLRELDDTLDVTVNEAGYFVVKQLVDAEKRATNVETDTTTWKLVARIPWGEWDQRVIREFQQRAFDIRNGVSRADTLDADDARRQRDQDHAFDELVKERAYPLFRAFQKGILGSNPRAFIRSGLSR